MDALINNLFTSPQANAIRQLWEDKSSRLLIEKEIGKQLLANNELLISLPLAQLMAIMSLARFSSSQTESYDVAAIVYWGAKTTDIMPMVTEHSGKELAYRCLIALGLFKEAMKAKTNRHAYPPITFYRTVGISSFEALGMIDISHHFCQWEGYLEEMFVLQP
jgi:hypothetical protein